MAVDMYGFGNTVGSGYGPVCKSVYRRFEFKNG